MSVARALAVAAKTLRRLKGVSVTYRRGSQSQALTATPATTILDLPQTDGSLLRVESRDFVITAADLELDNVAVEPARGDTIEETVGTKVLKYKVLDMPGTSGWRWSDEHRVSYRIHTKLVSETSA